MRQVSFDFLVSAELEAFVHAPGGTTSISESEYIRLLPDVDEIIIRMCSSEPGIVKTGSFIYDGWSARIGTPITGMTFYYIDRALNLKSFLLCFLNTEYTGSIADENWAVISSVIVNNVKLSHDTAIMTGTSDNHRSTAFEVEQYPD